MTEHGEGLPGTKMSASKYVHPPFPCILLWTKFDGFQDSSTVLLSIEDGLNGVPASAI